MSDRLVIIPGIEPKPIPLSCLLNTEGIFQDVNGDWYGNEIVIGEPKTCRLGLRCLYPLYEDDICPDEFPKAFTVDYRVMFGADSLIGATDDADFS